MKYICLDTETTGFSLKNDKIIELCCIDISDDSVYQTYINPEIKIPEVVIKIHGITNEITDKYLTFNNYAQFFLNFIKDATLIIHNARFDINFLNMELEKCNLPKLTNPVIDTLEIAKKKFPNSKISLDALKEKFNIQIERNLHGAYVDTKILKYVYLELIKNQTELKLQHNVQTDQTKIILKENNIKLNDTDLKEHDNIINSFNKK